VLKMEQFMHGHQYNLDNTKPKIAFESVYGCIMVVTFLKEYSTLIRNIKYLALTIIIRNIIIGNLHATCSAP